jgi:transposase
MKKIIALPSPKRKNNRKKNHKRQPRLTVGMDLGDKKSKYCALDAAGEIVKEDSVSTTPAALKERFGRMPRCRIAIEVGTHSRWVSRLLTSFGHEVIVANSRQLELISKSSRKSDRMDARTLARMARVDPQLLRPIRHRGEQAQLDLANVRTRAALVGTRTRLVNTARGLAKSFGERLPACDTDQFGSEQLDGLPEPLRQALEPLAESVEQLTAKIKALDEQLEQIAREHYPETELLTQVNGVGTLIALTFVLTIDDKNRFPKSRDVGCYVGLRPRQSASGQRDPDLPITKEGDTYLRTMLVQAAHCILREKAPDSDLKRAGERIAGKSSKNAKKRAVVAVARKLAVLLHRLWVTGEVYEPLRNARQRAAA